MQPSELLKKLSSLADKKREKSSWAASVVVFIVSIFAIFIFSWVSSKNSKELARLRHEKNKKKIEEENLQIKIHRELNDRKILDIAIEVDKNKIKIENIDREIEEAKKTHEENLKNINSITGWKDI